MSGLPKGWAHFTLRDLGGTQGGKTPSKSSVEFWKDGTIHWTSPKDMKSHVLTSSEDKISQAAVTKGGMKVLLRGSVLFVTRSGILAHTFPVALAAIDTAINQDIKAIAPRENLSSAYLAYLLKAKGPQILAQCSKAGTTVASVENALLEKLEFPLAPLSEQARIANKLDALLARLNAARARLDRVPALLKRFRQSVLAAATSGELTEDWRVRFAGNGRDVIREDARRKSLLLRSDDALAKKKSSLNSKVSNKHIFDVPSSWEFTSWGAISEWITYGFTRPMPSAKRGVRLLTAKDVFNFFVKLEGAGFTTKEAFFQLSEKDRPKVGDLLITKDGTIGRAAIVRADSEFCINQSVAVCWLRSTSMNKDYLELVANAVFTQKFVMEKAKGMAIQHLSITDFAQCPVPVPPLEEQAEIVCRVESLFTLADKVQAQYEVARAHVDKLTLALLAKAFRGELVPQDTNDEPAEELLQRLRARKADEATVTKSRRTKGAIKKNANKARSAR